MCRCVKQYSSGTYLCSVEVQHEWVSAVPLKTAPASGTEMELHQVTS